MCIRDSPGNKVLYVVAGRMSVEFDRRPTVSLSAGDCLVHPGDVAHRWAVDGDEVLRLFLVITHQK